MWWPTINGATNGLSGTEDLLDGSCKVLGEGFGRHDTGDLGNEGIVGVMISDGMTLPNIRLGELTFKISSRETLPECLMFFSFFLSLGGSAIRRKYGEQCQR